MVEQGREQLLKPGSLSQSLWGLLYPVRKVNQYYILKNKALPRA